MADPSLDATREINHFTRRVSRDGAHIRCMFLNSFRSPGPTVCNTGPDVDHTKCIDISTSMPQAVYN
jgi:hypothetical protein